MNVNQNSMGFSKRYGMKPWETIHIQQKNIPLKTKIGILNLERTAHSNFHFICKILKMAHTMVYPSQSHVIIYSINR